MIRQGLEADAAYVDAAVHGDGLTSLQFRDAKGGQTHEVQANVAGAGASADRAAGRVRPALRGRGRRSRCASPAAAARVAFSGAVLRRARRLRPRQGRSRSRRASATSTVQSPRRAGEAAGPLQHARDRAARHGIDRSPRAYVSTTRFEAPNWYPDGKAWLVNTGGRLLKIPMGGGAVETVNTGTRTRYNNDHGISPDGTTIVISDQSAGATATGGGPSRIYTLPIAGGEPKLVTPNGAVVLARLLAGRQDAGLLRPAQRRVRRLHDSRRRRRGDAADDRQGARRRPRVLARRPVIYFNSVRTGLMQIWKMKPDGTEQKQVTSDEFNNWFPHPSPDGRFLVFLSYDKERDGAPGQQGRAPAADDARHRADRRPSAASSAGRARRTCPAGRPTGGRSRS